MCDVDKKDAALYNNTIIIIIVIFITSTYSYTTATIVIHYSFNRLWLEYMSGFGNLYGEFWLGNEMLNKLTSSKKYKLRVDIWDWDGQKFYAEYNTFKVGSAADKYRLHVRGYGGNAGMCYDIIIKSI